MKAFMGRLTRSGLFLSSWDFDDILTLLLCGGVGDVHEAEPVDSVGEFCGSWVWWAAAAAAAAAEVGECDEGGM